MGNYSRDRSDRSDSRGFSNRSGGSRFGGRSGGGRSGGSSGGRFERRSMDMHDATCNKCGKKCQVPFRPTGSKPVLCSDCFEKQGNTHSGSSGSSGISSDQFKEINKKLDRIIKVLQELEIDVSEDDDEADLDEEDEEDDEDLDEEDEDELEEDEEEDSKK